MPFGSTPGERATMSKGLAVLFAAGATLVAVTLLVPHAQDTRDAGLWVPVALACVIAPTLWLRADHLGTRELHVFLLAGTSLITLCVASGGAAAAAYSFLYVWVGMYAAWFFGWRAAVAQIAVAAAAYALTAALVAGMAVPGVFWLMATGTVVVGGLLISELSAAIRLQAADLAAVARMGAVADAGEVAEAVCDGLCRSAGADVVVLLQPVQGGRGLQVTAAAGAADGALVLDSPDALRSLQRAQHSGRPDPLLQVGVGGRLRGAVFGLAQPILRDGRPAGVLVLAWRRPRRHVPQRVAGAAALYADEAAEALERQEALHREQERRALAINDSIVQGLVVAKYAARAGDTDQALAAIDETLASARRLITEQLDEVRGAGAVQPGDLVRHEVAERP